MEKNISLYFQKIVQAKDNGEYALALKYCDEALAIDPTYEPAWSQKGNVLGFMGRVLDALFCFQRSIELNFHSEMGKNGYGQCLYHIDNFNRSMETVLMAKNRAKLLVRSRSFQTAVTWLSCALAIDPSDPECWNLLGYCFNELGQFEYALNSYENMLKVCDPEQKIIAMLGKANALSDINPDNAIELYQQALTQNPKLNGAWYNKGRIHDIAKQFDLAMECYNQAVKIDPAYDRAWKAKAKIHLAKGEEKSAQDALLQYLAIRPNESEAVALLYSIRSTENDKFEISSPKTIPSTEEEFLAGDFLAQRLEIRNVFKGGMGVVYVAWDRQNNMLVALKTIQSKFLNDSNQIDLFIAEANTWVQLGKHRNIVQAFWAEKIMGKPYAVVEFIEGHNLREELEQGSFSLIQALDIAIQICTGMVYLAAHSPEIGLKGLVHGDIKPENILIDRNRTAKITDFGLAKHVVETSLQSIEGNLQTDNQSKVLGGTLPYMAPELFYPIPISDVRSDIFSFGVVLYEMLTGSRPFSVSYLVQEELINPQLIDVSISDQLNQCVLKCLGKLPEDRFTSFASLRESLLEAYAEIGLDKYPVENLDVSISSVVEDTSSRLFAQAYSEGILGNYSAAVRLYEQLLMLEPKNTDALNNISKCLTLVDRADDALLALSRALDNATTPEEYANMNNSKAFILLDLGRFEEAIECCDFAIQHAAGSADEAWFAANALTNKGNALRGMKNYESALGCYQRAIQYYGIAKSDRINKKYGSLATDLEEELVWYNQALTFYNLGKIAEAMKAIEKSLSLNPIFALPWSLKALIQFEQQIYSESLLSLKKSTQFSHEITFAEKQLKRKTDEYENAGCYQEALLIYDMLVQARPGDADYWICRGFGLHNLGLYHDAIENYDQSLKIDKKNYQPWLNKAAALYELGEYEHGLESIEQAILYNPSHQKARQLRELCLKSITK